MPSVAYRCDVCCGQRMQAVATAALTPSLPVSLAVEVETPQRSRLLATTRWYSATWAARYKATKAGKYQLTVMGADDGDTLPGSPFGIDVTVRCSRRQPHFLLWDAPLSLLHGMWSAVMSSSTYDAVNSSLLDLQVGLAAAAHTVAGLRGCETGCVEAGQCVTLDFQPRDSLGNVVRRMHVAVPCSSSCSKA